MNRTTQLSLADADAERLSRALQFALEEWNQGRLVAGAGALCSVALDIRRLVALLDTTRAVDGVRTITMSGDMSSALHQVARGCEGGGASERALAPLVRRVADQVAELTTDAKLSGSRAASRS